MPTYSYRCTVCGEAFDIHQSFSDANLTICPSCGGALRKIFSPVGVSFTGSGFYRNDSRSKPEREKAAKAAGGESSGDSKSGSTPESKSESKSEPKSEKTGPAPKGKPSTSSGKGAGSAKSPAKPPAS